MSTPKGILKSLLALVFVGAAAATIGLSGNTLLAIVISLFIVLPILGATLLSYVIASLYYASSHKPRAQHLVLKSFGIAILFYIVVILGIGIYSNYRTGKLNPYTQQCQQEGYKGAQGAHCTN